MVIMEIKYYAMRGEGGGKPRPYGNTGNTRFHSLNYNLTFLLLLFTVTIYTPCGSWWEV